MSSAIGRLVKCGASIFCDRPQRLSEFGLPDHIAGDRRLAARQQIAFGVGAIL